MKKLIMSCQIAIKEEKCIGCAALEDPEFIGNEKCIFSKTKTTEESIKYIQISLGVDNNWKTKKENY